jgi:Fis family transcriptional regulator
MIELVLAHAKGNQSLAAEMLGINRNTLRKKMQQLRIKG